MFEEYVGKHLKNRHKYIGLKYAKDHGFPELISSSTYGICFKDEYKVVKDHEERAFLVFRIYYDSKPVYVDKRLVPGRPVKTITEIELFGEGYTEAELEQAERIARGYLELAVECFL